MYEAKAEVACLSHKQLQLMPSLIHEPKRVWDLPCRGFETIGGIFRIAQAYPQNSETCSEEHTKQGELEYTVS